MSSERKRFNRRLRPLALGAAALVALAAAGCGEKSEPAIHPPTTVAPTVSTPTTSVPSTPTQPKPTPTAPVPKATP